MPNRNMHPEDVKATVRKTGITLSDLARRHGLHISTVALAVHRPQPSGNRVIARHLGKSLNEIWPEWFDIDGNRVSQPKHNRKTAGTASQKRRVG